MNIGTFTDTLDIVLRSVISVIILFALARLMGKKQISQLTFFDYIVGITIGSIAAAFAVDSRIEYLHGIVSMIIFAVFPITMSYLSLKSINARRLLGGTPSILIQNGKLVESNLRKTKFHVNDVLEECRMKGAFSIDDVEFAILETSGKISIQLKSQKQPVTPEDLNITTDYKGLSADLIIDGKVMKDHLRLVNLDEDWLNVELKKQNICSFSEVLLATLDTSGKLIICLKSPNLKPFKIME